MEQHPVSPATVSQPDANGNVVTIGDNPPMIVPWRGSAVEAVNEAHDLLEQSDSAAVDEGIYPFVASEDIPGDLTSENGEAG